MTSAADFNPVGQSHSDVYAALKAARSDNPIFFSEVLQAWVVTRYDDVRAMLDNPVFTVEGTLSGFNYEPETEAILSTGINWNQTAHIAGAEGAEHARLKKVLLPILNPRRLRALEPVVREITAELIGRFKSRGRCEFMSEFAYLLPIYTVFRFIGFDPEEDDLDQLARWSGNTFKIWLTPMDPDEQKQCAQDAVDYQNFIRLKIEDRRESPRDDLMSEMVQAMDRGEIDISEDELVLMYIFTFIGAGHETTMAQLGNTVYQLLADPQRWAALLADPDLVEDVVEEAIRYDGSVIAWYRRVAEDIDFQGHSMKAGEFVVMAFGSGNHDEAHFKSPEQFCPVREHRQRPLTFSQGRHFCLGAPLARLEVKVALQEMAREIPDLALVDDQSIQVAPSVATRSLERLELQW